MGLREVMDWIDLSQDRES